MHHNALIVLVAILMFGLGFSVSKFGGDRDVTRVNTTNDTAQTANVSDTRNATSTNNGTSTDDVMFGTELSAGQRALLFSLGIDADKIVITPTMVACAEATVGAKRLAELRNGATTTEEEGEDLIACYQ